MEVSRLLGSLLCPSADIRSRMVKGSVAFRSFYELWINRRRVPIATRVRLHESLVVPVIMYNVACAAISQAGEEKLDSHHRGHLRCIIGVRWPHVIPNESLYKKCKVGPLSLRVRDYRWRML